MSQVLRLIKDSLGKSKVARKPNIYTWTSTIMAAISISSFRRATEHIVGRALYFTVTHRSRGARLSSVSRLGRCKVSGSRRPPRFRGSHPHRTYENVIVQLATVSRVLLSSVVALGAIAPNANTEKPANSALKPTRPCFVAGGRAASGTPAVTSVTPAADRSGRVSRSSRRPACRCEVGAERGRAA